MLHTVRRLAPRPVNVGNTNLLAGFEQAIGQRPERGEGAGFAGRNEVPPLALPNIETRAFQNGDR